MLAPYRGTKDSEYPSRLAARIEALLNAPERLKQTEASVLIAQTHFDYDMLAARLRRTIQGLVSPAGERKQKSLASTGDKPAARF
jgi:hypothetical protein